jgi:hypothetical protein
MIDFAARHQDGKPAIQSRDEQTSCSAVNGMFLRLEAF